MGENSQQCSNSLGVWVGVGIMNTPAFVASMIAIDNRNHSKSTVLYKIHKVV